MNIRIEKIKTPEKKKQRPLDDLKNIPFEILEKYVDRIDFSTEQFLTCLKGKVERGTNIGSGQCADVFMFSPEGGFGDVCVKKIKKFPKYKINDIDTEVLLQQQAKEMGIRVPSLLFKIGHGKHEYIAMQKINGFSIKDAMEQKAPEMFEKVQNFSTDRFFSVLSGYIKKMNNEALHHRDLHEGNVMIEYDTGDPVIIDFGASTISPGYEERDIYSEVAQELINQSQVESNREEPIYRRWEGMLKVDSRQVELLESNLKRFLRT